VGRRLARFQRRKRFCRRHRSARYSWHLKPRCVLHVRTSPWPSKGRRMRRFPLQQHRYLDHWCQHPLGDMSPCFDIIPAANLLCSLCRVFANIFPFARFDPAPPRLFMFETDGLVWFQRWIGSVKRQRCRACFVQHPHCRMFIHRYICRCPQNDLQEAHFRPGHAKRSSTNTSARAFLPALVTISHRRCTVTRL